MNYNVIEYCLASIFLLTFLHLCVAKKKKFGEFLIGEWLISVMCCESEWLMFSLRCGSHFEKNRVLESRLPNSYSLLFIFESRLVLKSVAMLENRWKRSGIPWMVRMWTRFWWSLGFVSTASSMNTYSNIPTAAWEECWPFVTWLSTGSVPKTSRWACPWGQNDGCKSSLRRKRFEDVDGHCVTRLQATLIISVFFSFVFSCPQIALVLQLFDTLHALCNLLVVAPDNLKQVCSGEQLANLDKNILHSFVQLRVDYRSARLARHFSWEHGRKPRTFGQPQLLESTGNYFLPTMGVTFVGQWLFRIKQQPYLNLTM